MGVPALLVLAAGLLVAPDKAREEAVQKELKRLEGTWELVSVEEDGEKKDPKLFYVRSYVLSGGKLIARTRDGEDLEHPLRIDPSRRPKEIDVFVPYAMLAHARRRGIYLLEGDRLKLSWVDAFNGQRPREFTGKRGYFLVILRRVKR